MYTGKFNEIFDKSPSVFEIKKIMYKTKVYAICIIVIPTGTILHITQFYI